jgi:RNA polymerase sigma-70 factor (ECF subfamily)
MNTLSETEAIEGIKRGDSECFEFLYKLHRKRVYSICLRIAGNIQDAEEHTQEVFILLLRKISSFRGESAFSTWLHRLTVNVVLMHLREKQLPVVSLDESLSSNDEDAPRKELGSDDQVLAGSIDRVNLERAILKLSSSHRAVVVLHDIEGFEHNEIAELTGCSIGYSRSQLVDARLKLRGLLRLSGVPANSFPAQGCTPAHPWL